MAASGAGGAGGAAGTSGAADVWLAVDVVPVEFTTELDESMWATASCTLPDAFEVALAVWDAIAVERPEPLDDELVRLLAVTFDAVPCWVELAVPVPPVDPELPEMATGLEMAVDVAGPVLPVLVADDDAFTSPELPD